MAFTFFRSPYLLTRIYPSLIWRMPAQEKAIYLTFDDGPVPGPTEFVLDQLKAFNAFATFFCIGDNVKKYPSIFQKIKEGNHAVGNHTFNHLKGWNYSTSEYLANTQLCSEIIGGKEVFFRPPYGRIKSSQIQALKEKYKIVMWDVLTHDYSKNISRNYCLNGSIKATREGSIVVFHDSLKAERNLTYVLPRFLEHFSSRGFIFKSLPDNL